VLGGLLEQARPGHRQISTPFGQDYYWSASETEYATDVLFSNPAALARLYPLFIRHGLSTFESGDVLRFFGQKSPGAFFRRTQPPNQIGSPRRHGSSDGPKRRC
jgi:hypothetical protein